MLSVSSFRRRPIVVTLFVQKRETEIKQDDYACLVCMATEINPTP